MSNHDITAIRMALEHGYIDGHYGAEIFTALDRLKARILQLEAELAQPKHQRWQAPINRETP